MILDVVVVAKVLAIVVIVSLFELFLAPVRQFEFISKAVSWVTVV